jgi:16S rRNA processing protein RimM
MVAAGRVAGLFGAKGELTLALYDVFPREPDMEEAVFVKIDSHTVPLFFESFRRRGQSGATAVFADIDSAERAAELVGLEFSLSPEEGRRGVADAGQNSDDELFFEDIVGWEADLGDGVEGRITAFFESDLNPLLEVGTASGERVLIPAVDEFIAETDENRRKIVFSLPEGLLSLNG